MIESSSNNYSTGSCYSFDSTSKINFLKKYFVVLNSTYLSDQYNNIISKIQYNSK
jgi:hypothetical protein